MNKPDSLKSKNFQELAWLRFLLGTGGRLVQRVFLPLYAVFLIIYVFLGPDFFNTFTAALLAGRFFSSAIPATLAVLIMAKIAGRRMAGGITGWLAHLPAKKNIVRRITGLALFVTLLPLIVLLSVLAVAASLKHHISVAAYLAGLPLAGLAAAFFALPVKNRLVSGPMLVLACLCFCSMDWVLMAAGSAVFMAADRIAGQMVSVARQPGLSAKHLIHFFIIWRALRLRLLLPFFLALAVYPVLFLFLANNPYQEQQAGMAVRLAAGLSLILFCAAFVQILAVRRPVWLWERSLPGSAQQRILKDAIFLMIHLFPLLLVPVMIRWQMAFFLIFCIPALTFFSVLKIRWVSAGRFGRFGLVFGPALVPVFLFALFSWFSIVSLVFTPWLIKKASAEDRALDVSRWQEVSFLAEGDSRSWRGN